jgi:hypothetical protein
MQRIIRTVVGAALQTHQLLGKPLVVKTNSTLNQKHDIQANLSINETDIVAMKYVAIGNGGHDVAVGANGIPRIKSVQHTPRHTALYNQLPFVLRLPNDDLDAGQRSRYRLRKMVNIEGTVYVAYYLRTLDLSNSVPNLELRVVADGVTTSSPYSPTLADLSPTPPAINPGDVLVTTGDYVAATAKVPFEMSADDVAEFLNVCNVMYGGPEYAMISEIAMCSGVDRNVQGDFNGTTSGYTEAIAVQVCSFICSVIPAESINQGVALSIDIGSSEAMLDFS